MANHKSAEKRIRQTATRTAVNDARRSRIRTFIKKVMTAIENKDADAAKTALQAAQPEIQRGITKGVLHKNTAARKISRLTKQVSELSA